MSDGDKEGIGDYVCESSRSFVHDDEEFGRAVAKTAVAQICRSVGFHSLKESALESLTEIAIRCLRDLGRTANSHANLGGRTQGNVFDIILGFHDLYSSDSLMKEIKDYVASAEEIPFSQPPPRFPIPKTQKLIPSFVQMHESSPSTSIPSWLPAFPDPHTYIHTPVFSEKETDPRGDKIIQAKQRRKAFKSLLRLQKRLMIHGAHPVDAESALRVAQRNPFLAASGSITVDNFKSDEGKEKPSGSSGNPFLATPSQDGDKLVSPIFLPAKFSSNVSVSVCDSPFVPPIQTSNGKFKKVPPVRFKFKNTKKITGESVDLSFKDDGEMIEKKKEELILKQSIENPQEVTQL